MVLSSLRLALVIFVHAHYIEYVNRIGFYDTMPHAWQLTIWSFHVATPIAIRIWLQEHDQESLVLWFGLPWISFSFLQRNVNPSLWSCSFGALEALVLAVPWAWVPLDGLLALQPAIVVLFWLGVVAASFWASFSFLPLDRHLRKGWRHMLTNAEAQTRLLHDLGGHVVLQLLFGFVLRSAAATPSFVSCLGVCGAYVAIVLAVAVAVPPHRIPYVHRSVRRRSAVSGDRSE